MLRVCALFRAIASGCRCRRFAARSPASALSRAAGPAYEHRTVPNGCVEISHALGSDVVAVAGARRRPTVGLLAPGTRVVGVRLRPGAATSILGWAAAELVDLHLALDELWGRGATPLAGRLTAKGSPDAAAGDIDAWSADLNISARQLRRRFVAALGYGPKTLQRILRFQGFLALSRQHRADVDSLARLAGEAGYADQPHLTRECVRLAEQTPRALLREIRESCSPNHDHDASYSELRRALLAAGLAGGRRHGSRA